MGTGGLAPTGAQKNLEIIDFVDPGGGLSPYSPPLNVHLSVIMIKRDLVHISI